MIAREPLKIPSRTPYQRGTSLRDLMSQIGNLNDSDATNGLSHSDILTPQASHTPLADRTDRLRIQQAEEGQGTQGTTVGDTIYYGPVPTSLEATGALGARIAQAAKEVSEAADDANTTSPSWGRHRIAFGDPLPMIGTDLRTEYKPAVNIDQLVLLKSPILPDAFGLSDLQQYVIGHVRRHKRDKPIIKKPKRTPILKKRMVGTTEGTIFVEEVGVLPSGDIAAQQILPWQEAEVAILRREWGYDETRETAYWWDNFHAQEPILPSFMQWGYYQQEKEAEGTPTHEKPAFQPHATLINGVLTYGTTLEAISDHVQTEEPLPSSASSSAIENMRYIAGEVLYTVDSAILEPVRRQVVLTVLDIADSVKAVVRATNRLLSKHVYRSIVDHVIPSDFPFAKGLETAVDLKQLAVEEDLWEVSKLQGFGPRGRSVFKIGL